MNLHSYNCFLIWFDILFWMTWILIWYSLSNGLTTLFDDLTKIKRNMVSKDNEFEWCSIKWICMIMNMNMSLNDIKPEWYESMISVSLQNKEGVIHGMCSKSIYCTSDNHHQFWNPLFISWKVFSSSKREKLLTPCLDFDDNKILC